MSDEQEVVAPTDAEIFQSAIADAKPEAPADQGSSTQEAESPEHLSKGQTEAEHKADQTGRLHGADGKFVSKAPATDAAPTQQQPTGQAVEPKDDGAQVPSWRLRELREQREAAEQRAQRLEREYADGQARMRQLEAHLRQLTQKPKEPPDFYADPAAFVDDRLNPARQELEQGIGQVKEGFSRMFAIEKFGEEAVTAAYSELEKQMREGAGQLDYIRIMRSPHPFGELVKWHKQLLTRQTVGDDPSAWFEKQLEERLKDPAYQGKVLERIRGTANGAPAQSGSAPKVQLPPSLNKVASAARSSGDDEGDLSDASLWRHATR